MDDIDIRILRAMASGGIKWQRVESIHRALVPPLDMKELRQRIEILAETTPYVKDSGDRHRLSNGPEVIALTPYGLKFVWENL